MTFKIHITSVNNPEKNLQTKKPPRGHYKTASCIVRTHYVVLGIYLSTTSLTQQQHQPFSFFTQAFTEHSLQDMVIEPFHRSPIQVLLKQESVAPSA